MTTVNPVRLPMDSRVASTFERFDQAELAVCRYLNRSSGFAAVRTLFRLVSWLGDGWLWYTLIAITALSNGREGLYEAAHLVAIGAVGVLAYKAIKQNAYRERPFITHDAILRAARTLDRYSFPSGHTLHAASFTILLVSYHPHWAAPLLVFSVLVALSRVVLGLHYPTDVAAGALIGGLLGGIGAGVPVWFGL